MTGPSTSRIRAFRLVVVGVLLLLAVLVGAQYVAPGGGADASPAESNAASPEYSSHPIVATVDGNGPGQLVAYSRNGSVLYRNRSHHLYHDVDPVPQTRRTVVYVASDHLRTSHCEGTTGCIRNVVERVNLTTDNVTRLYSRVGPRRGSSQIHDVDRVNESVLLVGDIGPPDRVYMVNTTTANVTWEWRVSQARPPSSGGAYPEDWTHLNDVAHLADGRVMVNLRNQDQTVFVEPGEGVVERWTLGCDGCHERLYEQHNPDYIPASRGGPALLVADSENNRVVEYQRSRGGWTRTWTWTDAHLQWPRDADRLPDGRTLVVDSHGNRILEVNRTGAITWQRDVPAGVYDVEQLGTGDESAGGQSARALSLSTTQTRATPLTRVVPNLVLHGVLSVLPGWVSPTGGAALLIGATAVLVWAVVEIVARIATGVGISLRADR